MFKESIICIIIVILIFIGNNITQGYTRDSVEDMNNTLKGLRDEISQENQNGISEKMEEANNKWDEYFEKLAYFIEHDELEKVETNLTSLKSFIENKRFDEAINELDKCAFVLKHIRDKNSFNLMNIF